MVGECPSRYQVVNTRISMKFGVIIFPGSNCDHDAFWTANHVAHQPATLLWHDSHDLENCDVIIVPGGFAYGDYLRTGAIAKFSPVMESVRKFAAGGGLVLGICNGFQILCEAHLLPGALTRNASLEFRCETAWLRVETVETPFTRGCGRGGVLAIPVSHGEGRFVADPPTLDRLEADGRVAFRYVAPDGSAVGDASPNGSMRDIAGIVSEGRNVLGMMPHPERAAESLLGSGDGMGIFRSLVEAVAERSTFAVAP